MANVCEVPTPRERELQQVNTYLNDRIDALKASLAAAERDAQRYQQLLDDPETARHLLLLLSQGKGDQDALRKMQDRISASKSAALATKERKDG